MLFRELSIEEIQDFKQWARDNYEPLTEIKSFWHPVVQEECQIMNLEFHADMAEIAERERKEFLESIA
ncbi:MAG: hypothetical protein ACK5GV_01230 [Bacteroidota bacterium]